MSPAEDTGLDANLNRKRTNPPKINVDQQIDDHSIPYAKLRIKSSLKSDDFGNGAYASSTVKGVASFDSNDFVVDDGNVTLAAGVGTPNSTGSLIGNQVIYRGWSYIQGNGTGNIWTTVQLPNGGFDDTNYSVAVAYIGTKGGVPTSCSDTTTEYNETFIKAIANGTARTTTSFGVCCTLTTGTYDAANYQLFNWIAIGTKA